MTKRGRPRRVTEEKSDARVVSYFSKTEKETLQRVADRDYKGSISELMRALSADILETA